MFFKVGAIICVFVSGLAIAGSAAVLLSDPQVDVCLFVLRCGGHSITEHLQTSDLGVAGAAVATSVTICEYC
jgi:hypothetical protein